MFKGNKFVTKVQSGDKQMPKYLYVSDSSTVVRWLHSYKQYFIEKNVDICNR